MLITHCNIGTIYQPAIQNNELGKFITMNLISHVTGPLLQVKFDLRLILIGPKLNLNSHCFLALITYNKGEKTKGIEIQSRLETFNLSGSQV